MYLRRYNEETKFPVTPSYTKSNHPPNIIKQIPTSINRRISDNSSNEDAFNKAKPVYDSALKASGYTETLTSHSGQMSAHAQAARARVGMDCTISIETR